MADVPTSLDEALRRFDRVEANLVRAETLWKRIEKLVPSGYDFSASDQSTFEYRQRCREFNDLVRDGLPPIGDFRVTARPMRVDELSRRRSDAAEIDEPELLVSLYEDQTEPARDLEEYRYRFSRKRRELVRRRLAELIDSIDGLLRKLQDAFGSSENIVSVKGPEWTQVTDAVTEIERLVGSTPRPPAWQVLRRHLHFGDTSDLHAIREQDWPAVKALLSELAYDKSEPLPVPATDLDAIVAARPAGAVSTGLNWAAITAEGFERLIFELISCAPGYVNPEWLMETNAPDRGRDLSVTRVGRDSLSGERRERVLIQCKLWKKSIPDREISDALTRITHWEPPRIDVLIFATSGRFTPDAVRFIERRNEEKKVPRVEMWPETHLERLLAERPHIAAAFGLR